MDPKEPNVLSGREPGLVPGQYGPMSVEITGFRSSVLSFTVPEVPLRVSGPRQERVIGCKGRSSSVSEYEG